VGVRPRFVLTFLAWSSGLSGGDRHLLEVGARWREHVDVEVLAPPRADVPIREILGDVRIHELGSARAEASAGTLLALEYLRRAVAVAVRRLPAFDVAVAASHFVPDAAAVASFARRGALGVSYVYHLVAGRRSLAPRTLWSKGDERVGLALLSRFAGVVFVSNSATATSLTARGVDPVHTAVGIDVASFPRVASATLPPRGAFVARMARTKGVADAVRAWARVRESVPEAQLVMVGTGPERTAGIELAAQLGLGESVEWPGFVSEAEKRRILGESRVLVAPSYEEGWGISVCEALASGIPVVAYRHPVLDELFESAYLGASPGDVDALAALAVQVLTNASLAQTLSRRGRQTAETYDVGRVAEQELGTILRRWAQCAS
jgi:glycosyltransferase involved in cell wall biosynthesis